MSVILELTDVSKAYDQFKVVDSFDFKVNQGGAEWRRKDHDD